MHPPSSPSTMLVALTGSSGALGTEITKQLVRGGHAVRGLDKRAPTHDLKLEGFVEVNLSDYDAVLQAFKGCDAIIHCGAIPGPGIVSDAETHNNNVTSSYNVLHAAATLKINRVSQLSSSNALGAAFTPWHRSYQTLPITEEAECLPVDPYSLSKQICEIQAQALVRAFPELRVASLRPALCFPEKPSSSSDLHAQWSPIGDDVSGRQVVNDCWAWTYVPSIAHAAILGVTSEGWQGAETFWIVEPNLRTAQEGNLKWTSRGLAEKHHPESRIRDGWLDDDPYRGFFDCSKAETLLGFQNVA